MFTSKVTIITGASSGIGLACALEFAEKGSDVVLVGRSTDRLKIAGEKCNKFPGKTLVIEADVAIEENCKRIIEETIAVFGKIDMLVNNAGISMRAMFRDTNMEVMHKVMDINFWGSVYCTKYALPWLLKSKGSIIGILSVAGFRGLPGRTGYSASKFALNGFYEVLRTEHYKDGLHILIAAPGFTATNIRVTALTSDGKEQGESPRNEGKMMTSGQVANKIAWATFHRKKYLTMSFVGWATIWLNKFFPDIMDRLVYRHFAKEIDSPFT